MTTTELAELSASLLTRYYENDVQPFFDYCHDDVLWLGPAHNQMLRTKKVLVAAFEQERSPLRFAVYNLTATPFRISANCTEVLLTFVVDTFWPDGSSNRVHQRATLTWDVRKDQALIRVCHVSNAIDYDARDFIYPVHYLESHSVMTLYTEPSQKLHFTGKNRSILYTSPEQILYMESAGNHTIIHLLSEDFECIERLSSIAKRLDGTLLRSHASYLVNPNYVQSIERFSLTMTDGSKLPVPEKKYTAIKKSILNR